MAVVTITEANVIPSASAHVQQGVAGAELTIGQVVYLDRSGATSTWKLAKADAAETSSGQLGVVISSAARVGGEILVCTGDENFGVGGAVVVGTPIFLSAETAGAMDDAAPSQNSYVTMLMHPVSTTNAIFRPVVTNATVA